MYSFYGGRPGNSFVIITTFKSVKDMITAFKKVQIIKQFITMNM